MHVTSGKLSFFVLQICFTLINMAMVDASSSDLLDVSDTDATERYHVFVTVYSTARAQMRLRRFQRGTGGGDTGACCICCGNGCIEIM